MQYFVALVYNYYIFKLYVILILYIYEMNKMDMPLIIENAIIKIKDMQKSIILDFYKKSLKISKGQSESVYRRRTDNTMAKRQ